MLIQRISFLKYTNDKCIIVGSDDVLEDQTGAELVA